MEVAVQTSVKCGSCDQSMLIAARHSELALVTMYRSICHPQITIFAPSEGNGINMGWGKERCLSLQLKNIAQETEKQCIKV